MTLLTKEPPIDRFDGTEYRFLSNFYLHPIYYQDHIPSLGIEPGWYASTEHLYQAFKATNNLDHEFVKNAKTCGDAKHFGRKIKCRENWDNIKQDVMFMALTIKFKDPILRQKLLDTGERELIEGNTWGDRYWGVYKGKGENWLGRLLMELRERIRNENNS